LGEMGRHAPTATGQSRGVGENSGNEGVSQPEEQALVPLIGGGESSRRCAERGGNKKEKKWERRLKTNAA